MALRTVDAARFSQEKWFAFVQPALCGPDGSVHFLLAPSATTREVEAAAASGRALPLEPREVLRVSADGKKQVRFDPTKSPKLAGAKSVQTLGMASDEAGTLFLLVWATWPGTGGQPETGRQFILSFNSKGEYRSQFEVDWEQILVHKFDVFANGAFLVRGRRTNTSEVRIAVLTADGTTLTDIPARSAYPGAFLKDEEGAAPALEFDQMVRGGEGRIYVAERDPANDRVVIYAFQASGDSEKVLELPPMPRGRQFRGLRWADHRLAAVYRDGEERWWIALSSDLGDGALPSVYGPVPGSLVCFQRVSSQDRFTFLKVEDGLSLVTMSP